jgi:predicted acylesterase/phospholipase RssA
LVDGGLLNTVPVDVGRSMTTKPLVAVDVGLSTKRKLELIEEESTLAKFTGALSPKRMLLPIELIDKAYTITQARLTQLLYSMHPPDVVIRPELGDIKPQDFGMLAQAAEAGYLSAQEVLASAAWQDLPFGKAEAAA